MERCSGSEGGLMRTTLQTTNNPSSGLSSTTDEGHEGNVTTDTVIGVIKSTGHHFGEWRPTAEIRWARPAKTTSRPDKLEQKWVRDRFNNWLGFLDGFEEEWREVQIAIGGEEAK